MAVVRDRDETSGTPEVVNGLSCMACHKNGMKTFSDEMRHTPPSSATPGEDPAALPPAAEMNLCSQGREALPCALEQASARFCCRGAAGKGVRDLVEPIGEAARLTARTSPPRPSPPSWAWPRRRHPGVPEQGGPPSSRSWASARCSTPGRSIRALGRPGAARFFHRVANALGLTRTQV